MNNSGIVIPSRHLKALITSLEVLFTSSGMIMKFEQIASTWKLLSAVQINAKENSVYIDKQTLLKPPQH